MLDSGEAQFTAQVGVHSGWVAGSEVEQPALCGSETIPAVGGHRSEEGAGAVEIIVRIGAGGGASRVDRIGSDVNGLSTYALIIGRLRTDGERQEKGEHHCEHGNLVQHQLPLIGSRKAKGSGS